MEGDLSYTLSVNGKRSFIINNLQTGEVGSVAMVSLRKDTFFEHIEPCTTLRQFVEQEVKDSGGVINFKWKLDAEGTMDIEMSGDLFEKNERFFDWNYKQPHLTYRYKSWKKEVIKLAIWYDLEFGITEMKIDSTYHLWLK